MNNVILTGYMKTKSTLRKSSRGNQFYKNILTVPYDNNDEKYDNIPFIAFGENAVLIDKVNAGVTIEIRGKIHNNWDAEKKFNDVVVYVDDVTLTNNIQNEEAFVDNDVPIDLPDDDLPF